MRQSSIYSELTKKSVGFTLAEVLITLGIIGVVAAMTIPNLMTKMQWIQFHSQFKHAYATVSNALRLMSNEDEEGAPMCYYPYSAFSTVETRAECTEFFDLLSKKMKTMTICEGNAYSKGCIPQYKGQESVGLVGQTQSDVNEYVKVCSGSKTDAILNKSTTYTLIDGTIIVPYSVSLGEFYPLFFMDINGMKGPNKWGYDLFGFEIRETMGGDLIVKPIKGCYARIEKGGKFSSEMMRESR